MDAAGRVYHFGRLKGTIRRNGENNEVRGPAHETLTVVGRLPAGPASWREQLGWPTHGCPPG